MGLLGGFSNTNKEQYKIEFSNQFTEEQWGSSLEHETIGCMMTYEIEYNEVFPKIFQELEHWFEENKAMLEKARQNMASKSQHLNDYKSKCKPE